jgi:hypothetical protein
MCVHVSTCPTCGRHFLVSGAIRVFYAQGMGKGDHRKTRELDPVRLAELTELASEARTAPSGTTPPLTLGRTKTLDDPLTTGLLAEVSRRSQTQEFAGDIVEALLDSIDDASNTDEDDGDTAFIVDAAPITHARVTRRQG